MTDMRIEGMAEIIDDGTLDTVVLYNGKEYRFSSEFRYNFTDEEFLAQVKDEILATAFDRVGRIEFK